MKPSVLSSCQHNVVTVTSSFGHFLEYCCRTKNLCHGKLLHANLIVSGVQSDRCILSSLIKMYAKCGQAACAHKLLDGIPTPTTGCYNTVLYSYAGSGNLDSALQLFRRIPNPDTISYNIVMAGQAQNEKHAHETFETFIEMQKMGIQPDLHSFGTILKACAGFRTLEQGKQIHGHVVKTGINGDNFIGRSLLVMYSKAMELQDTRQLFDELPTKCAFSWNVMIAGHAAAGNVNDVMGLYYEMKKCGSEPNSFTFPSLLSAFGNCVDSGALEKAVKIHEDIKELGLESDVFIGCALIDVYAKLGFVERAWQVFEGMPEPNCACWTAMITGHVENGQWKEGFMLFQKMQEIGIRPNAFTFTSAVAACSGGEFLKEGVQLHAQAIKMGYNVYLHVGCSLVDMYCKCGHVNSAWRVFQEIPKNGVSWNAMIAGLAQNGYGQEALELYNQMKVVGVVENEVTFSCLVKACVSTVSLGQGTAIHGRAIKIGMETDVFVGSALVDMYAKCGSIKNALRVFSNMPHRNEVTWNALISGYAQHGLAFEALQLFKKMQEIGMLPNSITFQSVLSACSHGGLVEQGVKLYNSMLADHGIIPTTDHCVCMVDLFCRAGLLDDALNFINQMPFEPGILIWQTMLAACRSHGNMELAQIAARCILASEPHDAATYALLFDVYFGAGKWDEAKKVKKLMNKKGLAKRNRRQLDCC